MLKRLLCRRPPPALCGRPETKQSRNKPRPAIKTKTAVPRGRSVPALLDRLPSRPELPPTRPGHEVSAGTPALQSRKRARRSLFPASAEAELAEATQDGASGQTARSREDRAAFAATDRRILHRARAAGQFQNRNQNRNGEEGAGRSAAGPGESRQQMRRALWLACQRCPAQRTEDRKSTRLN